MKEFPADFTLGAATSSYQIEGGVDIDGRGPSIWDTLCRRPGAIADGDTGAVACDHVHRWQEDVALMASLGLEAYRFSVAWPRIFPTGLESTPSGAGLDFYERLVDGLLAAGITPWVTLYHWDLPQGLQDAGGWPHRETARHFVRYAEAVAQRLGDRVEHWITHNEPWCVAHLGHVTGEHAPGHKSWPEALATAHHVLLSHGLAVPRIRQASPGSRVGITLNLCPAEPASPSAADAEAARWHDGWFNRWYLDPLHGRGYPADMVRNYREAGHLPPGPLPWLEDGDLEVLAAPTDFLGINYYCRAITRGDEAGNLPRVLPAPSPEDCTEMGWEICPEALTRLLVRVHRDYGPQPLAITENGAAYGTGPDETGRIRDTRRVEYLRRHLEAGLDAIAAGVPLEAWFAWSLLDNFEWAHGYEKRFGLVWVDFETQERILKDSALYFRDVIRRRRP